VPPRSDKQFATAGAAALGESIAPVRHRGFRLGQTQPWNLTSPGTGNPSRALRRPRAARDPREGDRRVGRQLGPDAAPALPRGAAGGLGGGDRNSGTKSGTINARQRGSGAVTPSWIPRKIAGRP